MDLIITILPVVTKDLPISPRFTPYNFLSRCKFSTLTTRQPMVEFYLLTFPRFPLRKKEHKSYFGKNRTHDFRTSRCAAYLLDHSGDERLVLRTPIFPQAPSDITLPDRNANPSQKAGPIPYRGGEPLEEALYRSWRLLKVAHWPLARCPRRTIRPHLRRHHWRQRSLPIRQVFSCHQKLSFLPLWVDLPRSSFVL